MRCTSSCRALAGLVLFGALASGCDAGSEGSEAQAAAARARAQREWKIQVEWAGAEREAVLDRMDIYLVEEEDEYPEIFEIHGAGAVLVGEFPLDTHVGYDGAYERLIGKTIEIRPRGGDPREPKTSWVRLDGTEIPVLGGTFTVQKFTGKWEGSEGDQTCWGTLELRVPGDGGEQTLRGKFAVNCVTWG
jgi:hypothetical protein